MSPDKEQFLDILDIRFRQNNGQVGWGEEQ